MFLFELSNVCSFETIVGEIVANSPYRLWSPPKDIQQNATNTTAAVVRELLSLLSLSSLLPLLSLLSLLSLSSLLASLSLSSLLSLLLYRRGGMGVETSPLRQHVESGHKSFPRKASNRLRHFSMCRQVTTTTAAKTNKHDMN